MTKASIQKAALRWAALALALSSLSACVVVPAGPYRYHRYDGPPRYYHDHGHRRGWGAVDAAPDAARVAQAGPLLSTT